MRVMWTEDDIENGKLVACAGYGVGDHAAIKMIVYIVKPELDTVRGLCGICDFADGKIYNITESKEELAKKLTNLNARPLSTMEQEKVMQYIYATTDGWSHVQKRYG